MTIDLNTFRRLRDTRETEGGTALNLIAVLPVGGDLVGFYETEAGTVYTAREGRWTPERLSNTSGYGDATANAAAHLGLPRDQFVKEWETFLDAAIAQSKGEKIARRVAAVEEAIERVKASDEPTHPEHFTGTVGEMADNAKRYVEADYAAYWGRLIRQGSEPAEAAQIIQREAAKRLASIASYPPRSSDWLALPRWIAEVEARGTAIRGGFYPTTGLVVAINALASDA